MYVVADGRYVYDISKWMNSHPGGRIILMSVCGTDITNDYFHEAGFDASEFTPTASYPVQVQGRSFGGHQSSAAFGSRAMGSSIGSPQSHSGNSTAIDLKLSRTSLGSPSLISANSARAQPESAQFTETDWKCVLKCRRTHVHSKLAIERLARLQVGEIVPSEAALFAYKSLQATNGHIQNRAYQAFDNGNGMYSQFGYQAEVPVIPDNLFDQYEYRRYAITQITALSPKAYLIRFCLLYPYEQREGIPKAILPGECVEIQARIDGNLVSRYYSPINGNIFAFEVIVQVIPNGKLSPFLAAQRIAEKQFKVRGPFGAPLLDPSRPLHFGTRNIIQDTVFFIAAGSGITPFLQLMKFAFLGTGIKVAACSPYRPQQDDELELLAGNTIYVHHHYLDGWAYGSNLMYPS
jgi:NAD(P)H-flavin reductase